MAIVGANEAALIPTMPYKPNGTAMEKYDNPEHLLMNVEDVSLTSFSVEISNDVATVFAREFLQSEADAERAIRNTIGDCEMDVDTAIAEYQRFTKHLSKGRFVIEVSDKWLTEHIIHYASGVSLVGDEDFEDFEFLMRCLGQNLYAKRIEWFTAEFSDFMRALQLIDQRC